MLRRTCSALAALLLLGVTVAPVNALPLSWGIRGGWNFDSMEAIQDSGADVSFDRATGYNLGLFADLGAGPLGLRPGITYLHTGPLFQGATFLPADDFNLSYVVVPIDVRYRLPMPGASPYVATGPEFRLLADHGNAPSELQDQFSNFGVTWGVGLGMEIGPPMGGFRFMPEARYSFDMSGIVSDQIEVGGTTYSTNSGQKVNSWRVSLGLMF
ncbi:MAG: outer membrane beta-barrel protein [bacterium]